MIAMMTMAAMLRRRRSTFYYIGQQWMMIRIVYLDIGDDDGMSAFIRMAGEFTAR